MPKDRIERIKAVLAGGQGIRAMARATGASTTTVLRVTRSMTVAADRPETIAA